ncbi:MAG: ribonuclease H-like domain-containing protein [Bacteroidales bacterium]|nr:ribonuclease H-like domain-containing protein [Bacteroidales bacterium]
MELNLQKPIVFFDLETTGVNIGKDRIIQIGMIKLMPDGGQMKYNQLINPKMHIAEEISRLTGITDGDVAMSPEFKTVAQEIKDFIGESDLAGFNSNKFDIPLLVEEFLRCGVDFELTGRSLIDVQNIFHKMEQRTLSAAYKFYCGKELTDAHSADGDTLATLEVLKAQLDRYDGVEYKDGEGRISKPVVNDMKQLGRFSRTNNWADLAGHIYYDDNLVPCFNFGKHKGTPVAEVFKKEPSYYAWMMNAEFPLSTKKIIKQIKELSRI